MFAGYSDLRNPSASLNLEAWDMDSCKVLVAEDWMYNEEADTCLVVVAEVQKEEHHSQMRMRMGVAAEQQAHGIHKQE